VPWGGGWIEGTMLMGCTRTSLAGMRGSMVLLLRRTKHRPTPQLRTPTAHPEGQGMKGRRR
jgi:hypothetical protein